MFVVGQGLFACVCLIIVCRKGASRLSSCELIVVCGNKAVISKAQLCLQIIAAASVVASCTFPVKTKRKGVGRSRSLWGRHVKPEISAVYIAH